MNRKLIFTLITIVALGIIGFVLYPKMFPSKPERKILYWTDSMIPGDKSDHPGKSPMGMERVPVYADEVSSQQKTEELKPYYTCPMHPSVHKEQPGACPICGMTLVKKTVESKDNATETSDPESITVSPSKQIIANVATIVATRISLEKKIRAVGKIDYAEPNFRQISTRFPGRLDKLYLTFTGEKVKRGDPVADVYSPEAISAQKEYLLAKDSYEQVKDATDLISNGAKSLLDESRQKLLRWGFTDAQIDELDSTKEVKSTIIIYSPISGTVLKKNVDPQQYAVAGEDLYDVADLSIVWLYVDVYEYEMEWFKVGLTMEASTESYPGKTFHGTITFISPTIDPSSRTVRVRAEFTNPNDKLKLDMFMNTLINIKLPATVVVPATALLSTGNRQVVWIKKGVNLFVPRLVTVGSHTETDVQILQGIDEGDTVVTSGGYLLDSESQLETATSTKSSEHTDIK